MLPLIGTIFPTGDAHKINPTAYTEASVVSYLELFAGGAAGGGRGQQSAKGPTIAYRAKHALRRRGVLHFLKRQDVHPERVDALRERAEFHISARRGVQHPRGHLDDHARRSLDTDNGAVCPALYGLEPDSSPVKWMPPIPNNAILSDMGRMNGRFPPGGATGCSRGPSSALGAVGIIQSLLVTCKLHAVDPCTYLVDVLKRISSHPAPRVIELTPRVWKSLFGHDPLPSALGHHHHLRPHTEPDQTITAHIARLR